MVTMAFSWEEQVVKAEKQKKRREKLIAAHNKSFLAKFSIPKAKKLVE